MSLPALYCAEVKVKDEIELYKNLIYQYSSMRYMSGKANTVLREQLLILLAIYLKYGYSDEIKLLAAEMLRLPEKDKKEGTGKRLLNSFNHELKIQGYLYDDPISSKEKHLNKQLQELKQYIEGVKDGNYYFLYQLSISTK